MLERPTLYTARNQAMNFVFDVWTCRAKQCKQRFAAMAENLIEITCKQIHEWSDRQTNMLIPIFL